MFILTADGPVIGFCLATPSWPASWNRPVRAVMIAAWPAKATCARPPLVAVKFLTWPSQHGRTPDAARAYTEGAAPQRIAGIRPGYDL